MDFRLYTRVLWRFKLIVLMGLVLGLSLALLSSVRVSTKGFTYRQSELWSSTTRLGVTQSGFPWGRLYAQVPSAGNQVATPAQEAARLGIPVADPARFNTLAVLYAELASSDAVRRLTRRSGAAPGQLIATPLVAGGDIKIQLPLIDLTAISTSPAAAVALAQRGANALTTYLSEQERASNVPAADRVVIEQVVRPNQARIFRPRSKTMPIVILLAVMFATIGLAFLLENMRPRVRGLDETTEAAPQDAEQLRTA